MAKTKTQTRSRLTMLTVKAQRAVISQAAHQRYIRTPILRRSDAAEQSIGVRLIVPMYDTWDVHLVPRRRSFRLAIGCMDYTLAQWKTALKLVKPFHDEADPQKRVALRSRLWWASADSGITNRLTASGAVWYAALTALVAWLEENKAAIIERLEELK